MQDDVIRGAMKYFSNSLAFICKRMESLLTLYFQKMCVDGQYSKPYKIYFGEDVFNKFLHDMIKESGYCSKVIKTEFNKPLVMTEKDHEGFNNSTKC